MIAIGIKIGDNARSLVPVLFVKAACPFVTG
jgi:hypothetical protein